MRAIKECGGLTIVQDPSEAQFPSMPLSVMQEIKNDYSLPVCEIRPLLAKLSRESNEDEGRYPVPEDIDLEVKIAQQEIESAELIATVEKLGKISNLPVRIVRERCGKSKTRASFDIVATSGTLIRLERFPHYVMVLNAGNLTVLNVNPAYKQWLAGLQINRLTDKRRFRRQGSWRIDGVT